MQLVFLAGSSGLGWHPSGKAFFRGYQRRAEARKKRRLPYPAFTAQTGMRSWLAASSRRPGLSLSDGARFVPNIRF